MTRIRRVLQVSLASLVAGCGGADLSDLDGVEDAAQSIPRDAPGATEDEATGFRYGAMTARSPFEPFADVRGTGTAQAPDRKRPRRPQELFPLGQLEMVGTLAGRGAVLALIRDAHGTTHLLAVGDYLGRDHGRITKVRDTGIDVLEVVEDGLGGWKLRRRVLELRLPGRVDGAVPEFATNQDDGGIEG